MIKIISGGRTGVELAALDWAIEHGVRHGGYCTNGRRAEDGQIPEEYQLTELPGDSYPDGIERNVVESDATMLVTTGAAATEGSDLTAEICRQYGKPFLHIKSFELNGAGQFARFVIKYEVFVLNIAGSRVPEGTGIETFIHSLLNDSLELFLFPRKTHLQKDCILDACEPAENRSQEGDTPPVHSGGSFRAWPPVGRVSDGCAERCSQPVRVVAYKREDESKS